MAVKTFMLSLLAMAAMSAAQAPTEIPYPPWGGEETCYSTPSSGENCGFCEATDCCEGGLYISGICEDYPGAWRCCYSRPQCSRNDGCNTWYTCTAAQKNLACQIMDLYENNMINLKPDHFNSQGNNPYDGASALSEIRDMCYGIQAKRSAYGVAPGGCVCLQETMLQSMYDYATQFWNANGRAIDVNALAGSEHSANSWHYEGNTWDISCSTPFDHCKELEAHCRTYNPVEICYPGSSCGGHETWVHCATPLG